MSLSDGQYLTRHRRCTVRLQPLFRFDHDRSGRRQRLNLCSPLDGKPSVADLEDYSLADYILSRSGLLRKLDDALHPMRSSMRRTAIPAWSAFLGCEFPHCYRATILVFSYSRHRFLLDLVAPFLLYVTVTTPSSVRAERARRARRDSDSRLRKGRFGRLLFSSGHHHVKEQPVPTPATDPVYFPTVDLLAQGGWLAKAQIFRLHLHGLYAPTHPLLSGAKQSSPKGTMPPS